MELTLRYAGVVHSANGSNRKDEKQRIRKSLSFQLDTYWKNVPRLDGMYAKWQELQIPAWSGKRFEVKRPLESARGFYWRYPLAGYNYIPLLTRIHEAHCELDIRLYRRKESVGVLYSGGDIDNRLKVFLDALNVPKSAEEVPNEGPPSDNPITWQPLFCLVDDDSTVTKLSVTCIKLLTSPPEGVRDEENYLELDVDIKIVPITPMMGTMMMLHR